MQLAIYPTDIQIEPNKHDISDRELVEGLMITLEGYEHINQRIAAAGVAYDRHSLTHCQLMQDAGRTIIERRYFAQ